MDFCGGATSGAGAGGVLLGWHAHLLPLLLQSQIIVEQLSALVGSEEGHTQVPRPQTHGARKALLHWLRRVNFAVLDVVHVAHGEFVRAPIEPLCAPVDVEGRRAALWEDDERGEHRDVA